MGVFTLSKFWLVSKSYTEMVSQARFATLGRGPFEKKGGPLS